MRTLTATMAFFLYALPTAVLAQAAPAAPAAGAAPAGAPEGGLQGFLSSPIGSMLPLVAVLILFYFLMIRPQQQRAKEQANKINAVKRGDNVVLSNGMLGKIVRVEESEVGVEIATGVTVKVIKTMIADVRTRGEPAPANDSKG